MESKQPYMIMTIFVGILLVGALLVPIVSGFSEEEFTYTNEGMPFAEVDDDAHTITVTSSAITVDGEEIDQSLFPGTFGSYSLVYSSDGFIRYQVNSLRIDYRSGSSSTATDYPLTSGETVTIAISGDSATVSSSDETKATRTLTNVTHYVATEGDYALALNPVVQSDSAIYGAGQTSFGSPTVPTNTYVYVCWNGTIEGVSSTMFYFVPSGSYSSFEVSDYTINTTDLGNGLYRIDSVLIDYDAVDTDSNEYSPTSTYTYFLAPATFTYDNPNYISSGAAALLGALAVVIILAVLVVAVRGLRED